MSDEPNNSEHPVLTALAAQLDRYRKLCKLADAQRDHVQNGRTEPLLEILGRRQEILEHINALEQTVAPAKRRWGEFLSELDDSSRQRAEAMVAEARSMLEVITSSDRNDTLVLQQRKLNVGRQIRQAVTGRAVNRSYGAAAYGSLPSKINVQR
jgi:flagellar biosynthesis/type III secretory pathway chaperone